MARARNYVALARQYEDDVIAGRVLHSATGMEAVMDGAGGICGIGVATRFVRPVIKGGDESTKITVTAYGRA